jgi:hypothetical protein
VLLGDDWLASHRVRILYDKQALEILTPKRKFTIKAMTAPPEVSYTKKDTIDGDRRRLNYIQAKRCNRKGYSFQLCFIQKEEEVTESYKVDPGVEADYLQQISQLKEEYADIFGDTLYQDAPVREDMPEVVPITLGAKIPNKPLYRYSPLQQQEIERQVQAMLEQKLIEPSTSPYGAPVLLVKKA